MSVTDVQIRTAGDGHELAQALADVLIDCVEGGASVSFMWPLPREKALQFWREVLDGAQRGDRIVLIAEELSSGAIVGTVQLLLATPDYQPHRADIAKMLVLRRVRRRADASRRSRGTQCGPDPAGTRYGHGWRCRATLQHLRLAAVRGDSRLCALAEGRAV